MEDYAKHREECIKRIFRFVGVPVIETKEVNRNDSSKVANVGYKVKPVLRETKQLLKMFYEPFNVELAEMLGDNKWSTINTSSRNITTAAARRRRTTCAARVMLLGFQKSGTTDMAEWFNNHPGVIGVSKGYFINSSSMTDDCPLRWMETYLRNAQYLQKKKDIFCDCPGCVLIHKLQKENATHFVWRSAAQYLPYTMLDTSRYIITMREPADRMISNFFYAYKEKRENIYFSKMEDYAKDREECMKKIFRFVGVPVIKTKEMNRNDSSKVANVGYKVKPVLRETKQLLKMFYEPFNVELAEMLGDDKWLWK
ncbi:uncharacterized protein [Watersipora subatra]|uniref:uncharacterized protein n=1 Tax=Watersipora subatra TaxID=2589382 RepID=UPI00355B8CC2